jgi:hypothetical protein
MTVGGEMNRKMPGVRDCWSHASHDGGCLHACIDGWHARARSEVGVVFENILQSISFLASEDPQMSYRRCMFRRKLARLMNVEKDPIEQECWRVWIV